MLLESITCDDCVSIWNPYLAGNIDKLEQIQQRATKLVPGLAQLPYMKQDYTALTCTPCTLYCQRQSVNLIDVYIKLVNYLNRFSPHPFSSLLTVSLEVIIEYSSSIIGSFQDLNSLQTGLLIGGTPSLNM